MKRTATRLLPRKLISFFLCAIFLIFHLSCIDCSALEELPSTENAHSVYFYNFENDKVIVNKSSGEKIYPASMTKIVTGLVAIDLIGDRLDQTLTVTKAMLSETDGTSMGIKAGEIYSYRDLLYGTICGGFNDAAFVLASASAGSINSFVALMNEKAVSLGATETHYTNPTGWHNSNMYTTLDDTVKICKEAIKNELYMEVSSSVKYTVSQGNGEEPFTINNRNGLIGTYYALGYYTRYANGLIAGMTDEGGYCVATLAESDGLSYLCIVMGASADAENIYSYSIAKSLISYAVSYYGYFEVLKAGDKICQVPLGYTIPADSENEHYMLSCVVNEDVTLFIPYDRTSAETLEIKHYLYDDKTSAPINEGEIIGGVDIYIDGELCGYAPLCAGETVKANGFLITMSRAKDFITGRFFIISMVIFVILLCIYYYFTELKSRRKQSKNIKYNNIY